MAGKNLLVNGKNNITANRLANVQRLPNTASNVTTTPNLPTTPLKTTAGNLNLQKAQQPTQTKLNNLNQATGVITSNNPAYNNGALVNLNNQPSRFIGFQKPKLSTDFAGNIVNQSGNILNTTQQGKSWAVEQNKPVLNIPTQSSQIAGYNAKQEQLYKDSENLIKKFHYAVKNANGQLTANDIRKQFPEWKDNINAALQLQADITPLVQQGQFADMKQVSEYYNELLKQPNLADANKYSEKQKSQERALNYYKQRADKLLESNNTLSDSGKKYLQDMSQLADFAQYVRENYRLSGNPTDIDILKFAKKNIPEVQAIFDELNTIKLTGMDKAAISGSSKNPFQNIIAAVQETVNDVNKAYQENVTQPLTQMIESGELAKRLENTGLVNSSTANSLASASKIAPTMVGDLLQGADKLGTAYTRISQGQDRNLNEATKDIIKGGGGALNIGFNSIMAIPTALFHIANETDLGQEITDDTLGLFQEGITNILDGSFAENLGLSKDTYLSKWYNTLDEETKADLTNEITVGVLHKGGKVLKEGKLELEVLGDAISNAFEKGKGGAMFQAWIEKGLAGEDGKLTKGAKGRIIKEGFNEFKDALKTNFRLYDTVLKNRRGDITANMNTLPDNRTRADKIKSRINQTKENVQEGINTVKEGVNNAVDTVVEGAKNIKPGEIIKNTAETVGKGVKATSDLIDSGKNAVTKGKNAVTNTISKGVNAVKETVNENIVEPYNKGRGKTNQLNTETGMQGIQQPQGQLASVTDNKINGDNYTQKNTNSKPLNKVQLQLLQNNNRMNPKTADTFKERYGEDYGQFLADRGFTKSSEDNLKDLVTYKKDLLENKNELLNTVEGTFKDQAINDMIDHIVDYVVDTVDRKNEKRFKALQEKANNEGLTMSEINDMRQWYSYHVKTGFFKEQNAKGLQKATNIYDNLKDFLDKIGEENGLTSLREINKEIMKTQHIIGGVSYKMNAQGANNLFGLTDYVLGATITDPGTLAIFLAKQMAKQPTVKNAILNATVGRRGNAKNRITKESKQGEKEKIQEINKEKREKAEQKKKEEAGRQLQSDLSKSNTKALPNKGGTDGGKNILTNGKTIITDARGNSKVKGQISEIDKRVKKSDSSSSDDTTPPTGGTPTGGTPTNNQGGTTDDTKNAVTKKKSETKKQVKNAITNQKSGLTVDENVKLREGISILQEVKQEVNDSNFEGIVDIVNRLGEEKTKQVIKDMNDLRRKLENISERQAELGKDTRADRTVLHDLRGQILFLEYALNEKSNIGKTADGLDKVARHSRPSKVQRELIADEIEKYKYRDNDPLFNINVKTIRDEKLVRGALYGYMTDALAPTNRAAELGGNILRKVGIDPTEYEQEASKAPTHYTDGKANEYKTPEERATTPKQETKPQDSGRITAPKKERQIIKNDKGENEIAYHGTNAKFDKFDKNFIGRGGGFRFTTSKGEAESYGKNVKEYNLMASNIMDFDSPEFDDLATQIIKQYTREKFGEEFYISPEAFIQDEGLRNYAQELGYDALKFSKGGDTKYIVYNEDQIIPVQKQPKAKATKTSKNKVTNPSKAKTTSLFNENEVDKGNKSEGLNPDALPLSGYKEMERLQIGRYGGLWDALQSEDIKDYMSSQIANEKVGIKPDWDDNEAWNNLPEDFEDDWGAVASDIEEMYDAYEEYLDMKNGGDTFDENTLKNTLESANFYANRQFPGKTAKEVIDQYTPQYEADLKIYNRLFEKYPGLANRKIDLTGAEGRARREFANQENETAQDIDYQTLAEMENQTPQDIDYQDLAELENETPQMVDIDEGVDATTQLVDEFNNLKPGEFKWIGDNREAGVRKTFLDANIKIPGEGDSVDIYFQPGESGDKMYINLHDTSNTGIRNTNEVLNKLDIPYRIGSEFDEKLNETRYYLENKLTHSKAYFDKNGASWLSVSKTLRGKEIVPRRNAEEQAEYNMQMEQRRAEIEAEREQDRIKAEERKAEEERQQEIDKQMKANLLRYVDIKHNDNPLGRGRTLKDLSEKNSETNNRIRYYGDDVADDAGVWQVLDVLADKNGKIREVWESDSKSSYSYEYYDEELGRNNNISGLNKTQRDYLEYRIKASQTEKRVNNHLDKIENKSLKTRVENKLNEMKKWQDDNGKTQYGTDAQYIDYLVLDKGFTPKEFPTGKTYANGEPKIDYMIVNEKNVGYISSKIENAYAKGLLETPEEELSAEDEAKLDELFTPKTTTEVTGEKNAVTAKQTESEKPKNLVTNRIENTKQEIQEIDKDTYFDDIVKNLKDHPREMFIYKDGNYYYPHYILPSGKVITPENTYWGEVSSEEAARNWLLKEAEEHSEANETKKTEKLKEIVGKTAEKYEATLKRIESDNPMQEIWTSGDYFKYGMGNNQMARAKKESEANAEVGTFKKDVIDGKEGYRIFVAGTKNEAIRAFYEPKTGKTYRIYRGPIIDDSKPYTTKQVERIEKFLQNVEKQLDKETKREKPQEKTYITQEWLDGLKPDKDGVIELDSKGNESFALRKGKETLIKEGKADGKYIENYGGERSPQYLAFYIKDGVVYEGRKGLEDQYMKTKQEAVDWVNQKEKDVEHEATERYTQTDYETLPKTISVESEAEKAGPKRIAPDRVKRQQETYDEGLETVKGIVKQSPFRLYDLGFKSDRSKAVQDIMAERQRIKQLPESEADKQWTELAKSIYEDLVIKDISKGYRYPEDVTSKFPKAQMKKAVDARARYEKGLFTSFSAKDTRANNQYRDEIGAGIKSQDGKPVTQEQMNEIVDGIRSFGSVFGLNMKKFAEDNNIIYVHLHGGNPFLMGGGGKARGGGMNIAGLYRKGTDGNISISLGGVELVMEKGEDGEMKKNNVNATPEHELAHAVDYMLENKLFTSQDIEILKKTMNKPTRLINYYNRSQEIVARAVEQYAANKTGKSRYGKPYVSSQAYWDQENFDKYVKPIVEKNMKEKLKDYLIQQPKKNVLSNDKNKITSK